MSQSVVINNVAKARRMMQRYAPEVKKALDKANREAAAPLVNLARNNVPTLPLSGWQRGRLAYNQAEIKKGIKVKSGKRSRRSPWSAVTQLRNDNPAGAIFELAGTKTTTGNFVDNLNAKYPLGSVTRVIWKAVKEYPIRKYQEEVLKNYVEAEKQFQRELDAMRNSE